MKLNGSENRKLHTLAIIEKYKKKLRKEKRVLKSHTNMELRNKVVWMD